jgi:hypothetical protein
MKLEMIYQAEKASKINSKKSDWSGFVQPVKIYPLNGGPLSFDLIFQDGEKRFDDTQGYMRIGLIELASDRGDLRLLPASAGKVIHMPEVNERISSGELIVVDLQAWASEYREAGSFDDRTWDDSWIQSLTVLDDRMCPTALTLRQYHDFEADVLVPGAYRAAFALTSRKNNGRNYPSFRLSDVVPLSSAVDKPVAQVVNG